MVAHIAVGQLGFDLGLFVCQKSSGISLAAVRQFHGRDVQVHCAATFEQNVLKCHQIHVISQKVHTRISELAKTDDESQ